MRAKGRLNSKALEIELLRISPLIRYCLQEGIGHGDVTPPLQPGYRTRGIADFFMIERKPGSLRCR